jgi:glycosyltransferase involved in cell wall biosynthesis
MTKGRIGVVVPCFNEAKRLSFERFRAELDSMPPLEFIFVDDGSTDATAELLSSFRASLGERVHVLGLAHNAGKAEAVRRGVMYALDAEFELIGYWDADLATPLRYIGLFAKLLENSDTMIVVGSRVQLLGRHVERAPLRHYLGRGFASLAALVLDLPIYDTQCGAKLFRSSDVMRAAFGRPFSLNWAFDVELLLRLLEQQTQGQPIDLRRQCIEYPLEEWIDRGGSKLRANHVPRVMVEVAKMINMGAKRRASARRARFNGGGPG